MSHNMIQRLGILASSMLLLHAPLGAKKCKTFGSLVVKCALTTAQLTVSGNATIGGNLTVGGTETVTGALTAGSITSTGNITTTGTITSGAGTLGDLLAYGNWVNTVGGAVASGANVTFPTANINSSNISIDSTATNSIFTFTTPGTYLVLYQVAYSAAGSSELSLDLSTNSGTTWTQLTGGSVLTGTIGAGVNQEVSNASLVAIAAGNQLRLNNTGAALITLPAGVTANSAAITFIRLHA